jgi:hypothetical protein
MTDIAKSQQKNPALPKAIITRRSRLILAQPNGTIIANLASAGQLL